MNREGVQRCEPTGGGDRDLTRTVVLGWWDFTTEPTDTSHRSTTHRRSA